MKATPNRTESAAAALLRTGALQTAIFNSANFSSIATDAKGVIQIFNVGAERMLGYTAAEVTDRITPADISDPDEVIVRAQTLSAEFGTPITPGFEALVFKASRGIEDIYELTYIRKDGSRFPAVVSVTALRDQKEGVIGYLLIGTDNTARKQAETELLKAGALQRAIFNSANFSSIATDAKGVIQIFNVGAERMLGYAAADVVNTTTPAALSDPDELVARATALSEEFQTPIAPGFEALVFKASRGIADIYELTNLRKDGSRFAAVMSVTALRDAQDRIIGYLLIGTDNTARKLQQKNAELEHASRMKSEFLANMSHELRTPLNAVIGFSEVLRDGLLGELTKQQRGFVGDIYSSGKHLLSLINDILDLSKIEAGKMTLHLETVEIHSLLANALSVVREAALLRHIRLRLIVADDIGAVQADARKVKQIVYNLLSNAVKFDADEGEVTLAATRVPRRSVGALAGIRAGRSFPLVGGEFNEFLEIRVSDSGIGISPEGLELLFKPFTQIDSGLSRHFEGTGLGLAMVKLLVELHGGTVAVESTAGEGSTFTVWLPVRAAEVSSVEAVRAPAPEPIAARLAVGTALVIENDQKSAALIRVQLEGEGFRVVHAESGEVALAEAQRRALSLITLDITLPDMDGWELLARFKQIPDLRRIPIVIISIGADRNRGFALGAAAVMEKPVSRRDLYDSLVDLDLLPVAEGGSLKVLIVDDDPKAVELVAVRILGMASTVLRAYGGREAIASARRERPDLIVLDLMMPDVNGFDVVAALNERPDTARIPILVITAKEITTADRAKLHGYVRAIMEKGSFDATRFTAEVHRAMSGRRVPA